MQKVINILAKQLSSIMNATKIVPNPRAIEFVGHYLKGSQTNKTLNEREIAQSRKQLLRSMFLGTRGAALSRYSDDYIKYSEGMIDGVKSETQLYFVGDTHGVIGGWDFRFDSEMIAHCSDIWDFNPTAFNLELTVPAKGVLLFKNALRLFGCKQSNMIRKGHYSTQKNEDGSMTFLFDEGKLVEFNKNHAFRTEWLLDFTGASCNIDKAAYAVEIGLPGFEDVAATK